VDLDGPGVEVIALIRIKDSKRTGEVAGPPRALIPANNLMEEIRQGLRWIREDVHRPDNQRGMELSGLAVDDASGAGETEPVPDHLNDGARLRLLAASVIAALIVIINRSDR
jgi:hypothetical protein